MTEPDDLGIDFDEPDEPETPQVVEMEPPDYDSKLIHTAFPKLIRMKFKQDKHSGEIIVTLVQQGGQSQDISLGLELPTDTAALVQAVKNTTGGIDSEVVDEVVRLLTDFE